MLVSIVDRYSKLIQIKKVTHKRAELVRSAAVELLSPLAHWVQTVTADNGKEFAEHEKISEAVTDEQIRIVQEKLNRRPRKTLGFKTPYEVFFGKILEDLVA